MDLPFLQELDEKSYYAYESAVMRERSALDETAETALRNALKELDAYIDGLEKLKLRYGRLLDYNEMRKNGSAASEVSSCRTADDEFLLFVEELRKNNAEKREYMFGYPANLEEFSYTSEYLRYVESKLYLMNNCGDPYQRGNYGMDSKPVEQSIISLLAKNFGLKEGGYWGYVTSGGTESNFWAIREGFNKFPKGKLYFSDETHYSVEKFVNNDKWGKVYPYTKIPSEPDGKIDISVLKKTVENDISSGVEGVILVLTWGTTKRGAIDPVKDITDFLNEKGIKYYCHVDAALYGGIPATQKYAPTLGNVSDMNIDSLSVSLHKFIGIPNVNGILLALGRGERNVVDYIGQEDSTLLGSRDYLPFSTYQRLRELYYRKSEYHYCKKVMRFETLLKENGVRYEHATPYGNIFVIDKPREEICVKYQLSSFTDKDGRALAHIIIFPFHSEARLKELIADISENNR